MKLESSYIFSCRRSRRINPVSIFPIAEIRCFLRYCSVDSRSLVSASRRRGLREFASGLTRCLLAPVIVLVWNNSVCLLSQPPPGLVPRRIRRLVDASHRLQSPTHRLVHDGRQLLIRAQQSTLPAALRTTRRINPSAGRGLCNNRQKAGAVAGRTNLFNYFCLYALHLCVRLRRRATKGD